MIISGAVFIPDPMLPMITLVTPILIVQRLKSHIHAAQALAQEHAIPQKVLSGRQTPHSWTSAKTRYTETAQVAMAAALSSGMPPELFTTTLSMETTWAGSGSAII